MVPKKISFVSFATLAVASFCVFLLHHPQLEDYHHLLTFHEAFQNQSSVSVEKRLAEQVTDQQGLCDDYDGILFISRVIRGAGAGTVFFQSIVSSLLYAERYNLYPFLWVNGDNDEPAPCYDRKFHGIGPNVTFLQPSGKISKITPQGTMHCSSTRGTVPGPPDYDSVVEESSHTLVGNGLWQSYFEPITPFPFNASSCRSKPMFEFTPRQILPDLHLCSEFAVRGWVFNHVPPALRPNDRPMRDWLWDSRQRGSKIVAKHFRVKPWLQELIDKANPDPRHCLAVHIRLTDKGAGRDKKGLSRYRPYIEAYANATTEEDGPIYIATDDAKVLPKIQSQWPAQIASRVISMQDAVRSHRAWVPTFELLEDDKHKANTDALVEIYAMAKCRYFVHGFSGMSEAVVYINPALHSRSANIDGPEPIPPHEFERIVRTMEANHVKGVTIEKDIPPKVN